MCVGVGGGGAWFVYREECEQGESEVMTRDTDG